MLNQSVFRCTWAKNDLLVQYHDMEWGVPLHDDQRLFEFLVLEGAQAGLSWYTVLRKREAFRQGDPGAEPPRERAKEAPVPGQGPGHPRPRRGPGKDLEPPDHRWVTTTCRRQ